jgi:hypothetical protein
MSASEEMIFLSFNWSSNQNQGIDFELESWHSNFRESSIQICEQDYVQYINDSFLHFSDLLIIGVKSKEIFSDLSLKILVIRTHMFATKSVPGVESQSFRKRIVMVMKTFEIKTLTGLWSRRKTNRERPSPSRGRPRDVALVKRRLLSLGMTTMRTRLLVKSLLSLGRSKEA